jgi:hypothetical protein
MLLDADEAPEVPEAFVAVTVNVYEVDDCKPATVIGEEDPVPVNPPGLEVAVNVVAGAPDPAVKVTVAAPLLKARPVPTFVAVPIVGIPGAPFADEAITPRIGITKCLLLLPSC